MGFGRNEELERLQRSDEARADHAQQYVARYIAKLRAQGWHWEAEIEEHNERLRESRRGDYKASVIGTLERLRREGTGRPPN